MSFFQYHKLLQFLTVLGTTRQ